MQWPDGFMRQMQRLLQDECNDFFAAFEQEATRGLRMRYPDAGLQTDSQTVPAPLRPYLDEPIPWYENGYYIHREAPLGKTVLHACGAYYLQEPSAMAIARAVCPQPGERILDLCAAPGGKTTAIASLMRQHPQSQLVANEIHPARVSVLADNVERMGAAAAIVSSAPDTLAAQWPEMFDAILVDAPCSGEGMFRKDENALREWSESSPTTCAIRQKDILQSAVRMLRPGGRLIYSTCTLNGEENEQIAAYLIHELNLSLDVLPLWPGWSPGRPDFADGDPQLSNTRRLWPHLAKGEGHFVARFRKQADESHGATHKSARRQSQIPEGWTEWLTDMLTDIPSSFLAPIVHKDIVFSDEIRDLPTAGIRVLRPGTPLAHVSNRRLVPHHALAMRMRPDQIRHHHEVDQETAIRYLAGESLVNAEGVTGYTLLSFEGFGVGFVKAVTGRMNNLYPKGLRTTNLISL